MAQPGHEQAPSAGGSAVATAQNHASNGTSHAAELEIKRSPNRVKNLLELPVDILQMIVKEVSCCCPSALLPPDSEPRPRLYLPCNS